MLYFGCNPVLFYFIIPLVLALAIRSSFSWLCFPSTHSCVCVCVFLYGAPYFLSTTKCSELILDISYPGSRVGHFSKEPWLLSLENDIRNQELGSRYAVFIGVSFLLGLLNRQSRNIYVCILTGIYIDTYFYV